MTAHTEKTAVQAENRKNAKVLLLKDKTLNDLPFRNTPPERLLNAERSAPFSLNAYRVSILKINDKTLNDSRSGLKKCTSPFTSPRFLERGVRCKAERFDILERT